MSTPGVEPGLSRPQRDVLTTRRCGLVLCVLSLVRIPGRIAAMRRINSRTQTGVAQAGGPPTRPARTVTVETLKMNTSCAWPLRPDYAWNREDILARVDNVRRISGFGT